jgi:hypothetical protein
MKKVGKKYKELIRLFAKSVFHPSIETFDRIKKLVNDDDVVCALIYLSGFCATRTESKDWKELAKK